jgi:CBS domain-containing protein
MMVSDVMTRSLTSIHANAPLQEAAKKMKEHDIGALPVLADGKIVGMLTDRDIVVRGLADHADLSAMPVKEVMTANPVWCHPQDSVDQVAKIFSDKQIRRMLVVDDTSRPIGIISLADLAKEINNVGLISETLKHISAPHTQSIH